MNKAALQRIKGLIIQEFYLTRHSLEIFFDTFFIPMITVALFCFITSYFYDANDPSRAQYLTLGVLMWEVVSICQYNITVSSLWSVWSKNLSNIFIAPISLSEYIIAHVIASFARTIGLVALMAIFTAVFFGFNILDLGLVNVFFFSLNLFIFGWWVGYILLGFIFRYGTRIQAIAWSLLFLFQPIVAVFYPVSVLPGALQFVARCLPPTYIFEASRQALIKPGVNWRYIVIATLLNGLYSILSIIIFSYLFKRSKETGQFARNDH